MLHISFFKLLVYVNSITCCFFYLLAGYKGFYTNVKKAVCRNANDRALDVTNLILTRKLRVPKPHGIGGVRRWFKSHSFQRRQSYCSSQLQ